ncbi:MAG: pyridoxal-phosphate dependent enzyme [Caldiserica bacterium]|nr:pyridoxal-phosphate dependent enzyme [Caldisericota bacterium]
MKYPLHCARCGRDYDDDGRRLRCDCGGMLDLRFEPSFKPNMADGRSHDLWRYREALPVGNDVVTMGEGWTPLLPVTLDGRQLLVKQEQLFPTGSYKDRGAAVLMTRLHELGVKHVVEDSSGNAGCAVAAYAARAGIACDIYVPEDTSPAKTAQIEAYGAALHRVPGTREDTARAALEAAATCVYASHVYSPWFLQGTKTFAYEVAEQLGWTAPDTLVLPTGNGTLLLGAYMGFVELARSGIVNHVPRIVAVQAAACAPLAAAFAAGLDEPVAVHTNATVAEGIAIAAPARGSQVLAAVRASGGSFVTVSEQEIIASLRDCCLGGWFIEPTSAAVIAGARRCARTAAPGETIVTAFTGHGLKAAAKIAELMKSL